MPQHEPVLRRTDHHAADVRPIELFYDLVYVLAITELTGNLLGNLTWTGAAESTVLLLAVWGAWTHVVWITNYFDLQLRDLRCLLLGLALASLVMSSSLPAAWDGRSLAFALGLSASFIGGTAAVLWLVGFDSPLGAVFQRVLAWRSVFSALWIFGAVAGGDVRIVCWVLAAVLPYAVIWVGFPLPHRARVLTTQLPLRGGHLANRCLLFVTLALGESVLVTGSDFASLSSSPERTVAFAFAFAGTVAMWWIYFDRAAEAGLEVIAAANDPGRLGMIAYTFAHLPIIAGIIAMAAGNAVALGHTPGAPTEAAVTLILGGPLLFLAGNSMFKLALWSHMPSSRLLGIAALAALIPVGFVVSETVLLGCASFVLAGVALLDLRAQRAHAFATAPAPDEEAGPALVPTQ